MRHTRRVRNLLLTLSLGLFAVLQANAQMKIGNHPTQIHPASILELESNNQALRLTQGDTLEVNGIINSDPHSDSYEAAEGMIMYQASDSSIYMRTQGHWRKIVSVNDVDSTFWNIKGNMGTDSVTSFLGTLDKQALNIGANGQKYFIIHSNGRIDILGDSVSVANNTGFGKSVTIADSLNVNNGIFKVSDSIYIGKALTIKDSIVIKGLENALSSDSAVLVLGSDGIVRKMSLDSIGIRSINGIGGTYLHLKFDTISVGHTGPWIDSLSGIDSSYLILNIPDASPLVRGLVNNTTQAFAGTKSFADSLAVGMPGKPNAAFQVNGNINTRTNVVPPATATYDMATDANGEANYRTIIFDVTTTTGGVTVTLPDAANIDGRIYTFKKIGSATDAQLENPVTINTSGGQTIEGDSGSFTIYNNFTTVSLQAQNGEWYIVGH